MNTLCNNMLLEDIVIITIWSWIFRYLKISLKVRLICYDNFPKWLDVELSS